MRTTNPQVAQEAAQQLQKEAQATQAATAETTTANALPAERRTTMDTARNADTPISTRAGWVKTVRNLKKSHHHISEQTFS